MVHERFGECRPSTGTVEHNCAIDSARPFRGILLLTMFVLNREHYVWNDLGMMTR